MDADGYPDDDDLQKIKDWNIAQDPVGLIEFLRSIWWMPSWGFKKTRHKLELHTGGWSGNESIIEVLQGTPFWYIYWESSRRGGHYYFDDRIVKNKWK